MLVMSSSSKMRSRLAVSNQEGYALTVLFVEGLVTLDLLHSVFAHTAVDSSVARDRTCLEIKHGSLHKHSLRRLREHKRVPASSLKTH